MDAGVFMRNYSTVKRIRTDYMTPPADAPEVTGEWYWGPPGVGKSYRVREENPRIFDKACNKWWDGWRDDIHDVAMLDDFDLCHKVLGHHLKRWADRYSFSAEVKGGSLNIRPAKVVITSNYSPEQVFIDDPVMLSAIKRRFKVVHMRVRLLPRFIGPMPAPINIVI